MDKSRVCVANVKNLVRGTPCPRKTNLLVYDKNKEGDSKPRATSNVPPIAHIPVTKIRVCTGAELKRMCPELPCECPPTRAGWSLISGLRSLVGFGLKAALAAALVYWSYDIGLWGDSTRTEEIYSEICQAIMPMFCSKSARDTLQPRELSELCEAEMDMMCVRPDALETVPGTCSKAPSSEKTAFAFKDTWNKGVVKTFDIVAHFPAYAVAAYKYVSDKIDTTKEKCDKKD